MMLSTSLTPAATNSKGTVPSSMCHWVDYLCLDAMHPRFSTIAFLNSARSTSYRPWQKRNRRSFYVCIATIPIPPNGLLQLPKRTQVWWKKPRRLCDLVWRRRTLWLGRNLLRVSCSLFHSPINDRCKQFRLTHNTIVELIDIIYKEEQPSNTLQGEWKFWYNNVNRGN